MSRSEQFEPGRAALHATAWPERIQPIVTARPAPVLPVLGQDLVLQTVGTLSFRELLSVLRTRMVPLFGGDAVAFAGTAEEAALRRQGQRIVAIIEPADFHRAIFHLWGDRLRNRATLRLHHNAPVYSARRRFTPLQLAAVTGLSGLAMLWLWLFGVASAFAAASLMMALFFLSVVATRLLVVLTPDEKAAGKQPLLADSELPDYTVLVPLYDEEKSLPRLLACLCNLDYPRHKLDIKIIVEEKDNVTRSALAAHELPGCFEVIVVPAGTPQTKPRALNYALQFARGALVTIYDAEDLPSPRQLRMCATRFHRAPPSLACLQARLSIYNGNENWLTRQFSIEYASLFGEILPSLAKFSLPLPLGGTSNHFRAAALHRVGGWDPFNVTEDADLGFRLARLGFKTGTVDSDTFEEACVDYSDWKRQRARWLKGFLQTWLVHMRAPVQCWRELGAAGFWILQVSTLGVFLSALLHPLCLLLVLASLIMSSNETHTLLQIDTWIAGLSLSTFAAGYIASLMIAARAITRTGLEHRWRSLASVPLYWITMMPAAWLALYQFGTDLHGWNKTRHGVSKLFAGD